MGAWPASWRGGRPVRGAPLDPAPTFADRPLLPRPQVDDAAIGDFFKAAASALGSVASEVTTGVTDALAEEEAAATA